MAPTFLVTGGAGFIGSRLAGALLEDGAEVIVVDDLSTGKRANVPAEALLVEADVSREDGIAALPSRSYDAVLHLAGQASGEISFSEPIRDFDGNARSTALLAQWALKEDVPVFLHASTMGVYGDAYRRPVTEDDLTVPSSYYGVSKLAAERVLAVAAAQGLRTCSLRMFNVYGAGQDLTNMRQGMVSIYLAYVLRGEPIVVRGSLDRVRDLIHVDDVVAAWRAALQRDVEGPLNVGTGVGTSVRQLLGALLDACGADHDYPVETEGSTPGDITHSVADIDRARRELAWEPRIDLRTGLQAFAAAAAVA